jgi:hypothetical protein
MASIYHIVRRTNNRARLKYEVATSYCTLYSKQKEKEAATMDDSDTRTGKKMMDLIEDCVM